MDHDWLNLPDPEHPDFRDPTLADKLRNFIPLVQAKGGLYTFEPVDPYSVAFTWNPKLLERVGDFRELRREPVVTPCGYYGFVKPTLAEMVAQIGDWMGVNAFYVDMTKTVWIYKSGGYQRLEAVFGNVPKAA